MEKKKVILFIDGFNLYHSINKNHLKIYKWLNFQKLATHLISNNVQTVVDVYYFTALARWNKEKVRKHRIYINALKEFGIKVVLGKFRRKSKYCNHCKRSTMTYEEKETDVNIALHLLKLAYKDEYDIAMILSGDSDLIPAVKEVKNDFPEKEIVIIVPPNGKAENLKRNADRHIKLTERHFKNNQLPNEISCKNGGKIKKPTRW